MNLNQQQQAAYDLLKDFVLSKHDGSMYCLKGYAGTGKTYLISQLVNEVKKLKKNWQIALTAPTNKAVQVLRESSNLPDVTYKTIHSLLGLKEVIKDSGEIEFERDYESNQAEVSKYRILIIDEVSMLQDNLFFQIRRFNSKVKIILMGDPAQIPPVNKEDCEPFLNPEQHKIKEIQLTQIMRQANGSKITVCAGEVRENLSQNKFKFSSGADMDVYNIPSDRAALVSVFYEFLYKNCDTRVIAWTNKKVSEYNQFIRKIIYGENLAKILVDEKLILNKPYFTESNGEPVLLSTNQEVKVLEFEVKEVELPLKYKVMAYVCRVEFINKKGEKDVGIINVLHEDSKVDYSVILDYLKKIAVKASYEERRDKWKDYYSVLKSLADVSYAYAITAHKSQGSTYNTCIVDAVNIEINDNVIERNRILYTAMTRAKNKLIYIQ